MNIKTALCLMSLGTCAITYCASTKQLKTELAQKEEQIKILREKILQEHHEMLEMVERCKALGISLMDKRMKAFSEKNPGKKADVEEIASKMCGDLELFHDSFYNSTEDTQSLLNSKDFSDFNDQAILKFYVLELSRKDDLLKELIAQWGQLLKDAYAIRQQLK